MRISLLETADSTSSAVDVELGETLREEIVAAGGRVVVRPDAGDPTVVVPRIRSLAASFGASHNAKGSAVLAVRARAPRRGMDLDAIATLVAVGMGGGLLQKVDRDTLGFAMKLSALRIDGGWHDVYKAPKTDAEKRSKRGRLPLVSGERPGSFGDRPSRAARRSSERASRRLPGRRAAHRRAAPRIRARVATAPTVTSSGRFTSSRGHGIRIVAITSRASDATATALENDAALGPSLTSVARPCTSDSRRAPASRADPAARRRPPVRPRPSRRERHARVPRHPPRRTLGNRRRQAGTSRETRPADAKRRRRTRRPCG